MQAELKLLVSIQSRLASVLAILVENQNALNSLMPSVNVSRALKNKPTQIIPLIMFLVYNLFIEGITPFSFDYLGKNPNFQI